MNSLFNFSHFFLVTLFCQTPNFYNCKGIMSYAHDSDTGNYLFAYVEIGSIKKNRDSSTESLGMYKINCSLIYTYSYDSSRSSLKNICVYSDEKVRIHFNQKKFFMIKKSDDKYILVLAVDEKKKSEFERLANIILLRNAVTPKNGR